MITNQLFKIFGKVTTIPNEYETRFQELITIASAVGVAASKSDRQQLLPVLCQFNDLAANLIHSLTHLRSPLSRSSNVPVMLLCSIRGPDRLCSVFD
jgi:hypothetical protein